jgi:hypothetical protein
MVLHVSTRPTHSAPTADEMTMESPGTHSKYPVKDNDAVPGLRSERKSVGPICHEADSSPVISVPAMAT